MGNVGRRGVGGVEVAVAAAGVEEEEGDDEEDGEEDDGEKESAAAYLEVAVFEVYVTPVEFGFARFHLIGGLLLDFLVLFNGGEGGGVRWRRRNGGGKVDWEVKCPQTLM